MNNKIEIYTTKVCPYCDHAKALLQRKNQQYIEIDVSGDDQLRQFMVQRANGLRTVPQIFINDTHVGGYTDLAALDQSGALDKMLGQA